MTVIDDAQVAKLRKLADDFLSGANQPPVGQVLGAGASAAVFELTEKRALKVYDPVFFARPSAAAERRRLKLQERLIGHACNNLVQVYSVNCNGITCFVEMELVQGPDLSSVLQKIPRVEIHPIIRQLVTAVRFLEAVGLVHRDIKPQNIKISADFKSLKLLDLGVVREFDHGEGPDATAQGLSKPFIATAQYSSPEYLFWLHPPSRELWAGLSIYQVGAVLHDLIARAPLFVDEVATENRYALAMAVLQKVPDTRSGDVPGWLCALAARCLTKDLNRRLSIVSWKDFEDPGEGIASVVRKFQQLRQHGVTQVSDALKQHERLLRLEKMMDVVSDRLLSLVKESFQGCQLQSLRSVEIRTLIFQIPKTNILIDFAAEFKWSEISVEDTAAVLTGGRMRPDSVQYEECHGVTDVCTLSESTIDATVTSLFAKFAAYVDQGLDVAMLSSGVLNATHTLDKIST